MPQTPDTRDRTMLKRLPAGGSRLLRPVASLWARRGYFRPAPPQEPPRRVAILACHWIGDSLWAMQVVPPLRALWPRAHWTVYGKPVALPLWHGRDVHAVPAAEVVSDRHRETGGWGVLVRRALSERVRSHDLVIDLTGNRYSALFAFLLRPAWAIGFDADVMAGCYSLRVSGAERPGAHLAERPFRVVEPLLGRFAFSGVVAPPATAIPYAAVCRQLDLDPDRPLGMVAPGAGWPAKQAEASLFAEVLSAMQQAGWQTVVTGSPGEEPLCRRLAARCGRRPPLLCRPTIEDACSLLGGCTAFVGNDSGLGHVAAAFGAATVSIFTGATDPALCAPIGPRARAVLQRPDRTAVLGEILTVILNDR